MIDPFIPVYVWLAWGLVFSIITFKGERNQHNTYFIWLRKTANGENHQPSVAIQEKGEYRLGKLIGAACGAGAAYFTQNIYIAGAACVLGNLVIYENFFGGVSSIGKHFDVAGHGAEIMAAERAGISGYREAEARRVARDYKITTIEALEWLDDMRWLARITYWLGRW